MAINSWTKSNTQRPQKFSLKILILEWCSLYPFGLNYHLFSNLISIVFKRILFNIRQLKSSLCEMENIPSVECFWCCKKLPRKNLFAKAALQKRLGRLEKWPIINNNNNTPPTLGAHKLCTFQKCLLLLAIVLYEFSVEWFVLLASFIEKYSAKHLNLIGIGLHFARKMISYFHIVFYFANITAISSKMLF